MIPFLPPCAFFLVAPGFFAACFLLNYNLRVPAAHIEHERVAEPGAELAYLNVRCAVVHAYNRLFIFEGEVFRSSAARAQALPDSRALRECEQINV